MQKFQNLLMLANCATKAEERHIKINNITATIPSLQHKTSSFPKWNTFANGDNFNIKSKFTISKYKQL